MSFFERPNCRPEGNCGAFNDSADEIETAKNQDVSFGLLFILDTARWIHHHDGIACHHYRGFARVCILPKETF